MNEHKTKKKNRSKHVDKRALWNQFDIETGTERRTNLECVYRGSGQRELCDCCGSGLETADEGFPTCTNPKCGVIYRDVIDHGAEWRFYGADDSSAGDPTRCGMPINPLLQESSFGCKVLCKPRDSYEMRKVRRYTEWQSMPYREKSQYDEFQKISALAGESGLPKLIIDDAMRYHKNISEHRTFRGLNREGIIAASIYIAARLNGFPRTPKEIATIFRLDSDVATRGCKNALSIVYELENSRPDNEKTILCQTTPVAFIERYCSRLGINCELTRLCKFIATRVHDHNLVPENTPPSIAAGIIYFVGQVCNANVSKKAVNNVTEISEVTINKCYKKLEDLKDQLVPSAIITKYTK